jgi:HK97 family phage portal protein
VNFFYIKPFLSVNQGNYAGLRAIHHGGPALERTTIMDLISLGLSPPERRATPFDNPAVSLSSTANWAWLSGGRDSAAGELINDVTALQITTVFSCIRVLAESVASLPVKLFTVTDKGRIQEINSPIHYLLSVSPNEEMSSFTLFETMMCHLALTGNAYVQIQRKSDGSPLALWPLNPRLTNPVRLPNGTLAYKTTDGEAGGQSRILAAADVIHVPLTSWDGLVGMSPIMQARQSLGLAAAAEKFGARLFANSAVPQLALTTTQLVKPEDKLKMRRDWEALQTGSSQHRVAVIDGDMKIEKLGITPEEGQFLETRHYTRADIAALFRVPAHMVGELQKLSNSNTENMNLSFVVDTLRPYLSRIEAELTRKLLPRETGKISNLTVQFDVTERLRGDYASQTAGAAAGRIGGWLTGNDVRRSMGLNEAGPELDVFLVPVNYQNADRLLNESAPTETVVNNAA